MANEELVLSIVPADNLTAYNCALEVARRKDEENKAYIKTIGQLRMFLTILELSDFVKQLKS